MKAKACAASSRRLLSPRRVAALEKNHVIRLFRMQPLTASGSILRSDPIYP